MNPLRETKPVPEAASAAAAYSGSPYVFSVHPKDSFFGRLYRRKYFLSPLILQKIIWIPTRFMLKVFGHLEISGLENLRGIRGPVVFASNHSSELDPFFVPASLPFFSRFSPIFYGSRERSFYKNSGWRQNFYGGGFFKAWGAYPVYVGLKNFGRSLKNQVEILKDGGSLCFFPEGKTTPDGNIQPGKGGISFLAYKSRVPIIPVRIRGAFRFSFKDFLARKISMSISYGKPIHFFVENSKNLSFGDFKVFSDALMQEIKNL